MSFKLLEVNLKQILQNNLCKILFLTSFECKEMLFRIVKIISYTDIAVISIICHHLETTLREPMFVFRNLFLSITNMTLTAPNSDCLRLI